MVEQDYWFCILPLAAIKAVEVGVSGIIVSNHGARQLDYVPATISALEEVILSAFMDCSVADTGFRFVDLSRP